MSTLQERLNDDWKTAMRNKDALRRDTLSGLRAAIKTAQINARTGEGDIVFDDEATMQIIEREAKKRRDSIEEYTKANREDLASKERDELEIVQDYLPQQLSDEELQTIVREVVAETGASKAADMGAVMKALMPRVAGRADGKRVNGVVRGLLS